MCHGRQIEARVLRVCQDCERRTAEPTDRQTYIVPAARRIGTAWHCINRSSLPGSGKDFAPAGVATSVGALSSEA
jgi:hypothetical protein